VEYREKHHTFHSSTDIKDGSGFKDVLVGRLGNSGDLRQGADAVHR
jgi:hypothetical protein